MAKLNVLEQARLNRRLAINSDRIKRLEAFLRGQPLGRVRFADASITNAKVGNVSANKITSGRVAVGTEITVNDGYNDIIYIDRETLKVAKTGFTAKTTDPKNLIIDSEIPCLKFLQLGKTDVNLNSAQNQIYEEEITTPLPIVILVYLYVPSVGRYKMVVSETFPNYFGDFLHARFEFDDEKLYVRVWNDTGVTVNTHYYWYLGYA